jgi:hypothetical protein
MATVLAAGEAHGVPTVYVSLGTTHPKIVQATQAWLEVFALRPEACYGRSLSVLAGPDTQWQRLKDVMDAARNGEATTTRLVLYTTAGKKALYAVSALPTLVEGQMPVARLCMRRTDAIPCKIAASEDGRCSLLVKAQRPFRISCVSEVFEHRFGIRADAGVQRTIGVLHGPQTNLVVWQALFNAALSGRAGQGAVSVYTGDGAVVPGEVCFTPVLGKDDIEFVRVTIEEEEECKAASRSPRNVEASSADNFMPRSTIRGDHRCDGGRQRKTSPMSVASRTPTRNSMAPASTSMGSVKELIATRTRRRLQQEEDSRREAEEQPAKVDTSGFWAFFFSLLMVVLVRCNLASSTPRTRRECRGTSSAYTNSWKHVHGIGILGGMSEGDLDFYSPY